MTKRSLPKYKNPPINEVVFGVSFDTLNKMKAAHIGLFWDSVKNEFPKCEEAPVIGDINEIIEPTTGLPTPRTWLINDEDDHLIQIQKNKFLHNWRKRNKKYPHFDDISNMFFKHLEKFTNFILANDLGFLEYKNFELTYINNIPKGEGWDEINLIGNLLPDLNWRNNEKRYLKKPEAIVWQSVFKMPGDSGKLIVKLQSASRITDNHPLIILEISAQGIGTEKTVKDMYTWFSIAHELIVFSFEDLTSDSVQKDVWRKV